MSDPEDLEWVFDFLEEHRERFRPHDWPAPTEPDAYGAIVRDWQYALGRNRVTRDEARAASLAMLGNPPGFRREHIPALLVAVRSVRAARAESRASRRADPGPDPGDDAAREHWLSRDDETRGRWRSAVDKAMPFVRRHLVLRDKIAAWWCLHPEEALAPKETADAATPRAGL